MPCYLYLSKPTTIMIYSHAMCALGTMRCRICENSLNYQHCKSMPLTRTFDEVSTKIMKGWKPDYSAITKKSE